MTAPISVFQGLTQDATFRRKASLADHMQQEGSPWYFAFSYSGTLSNGQTLGQVTVSNYSRATWVEALEISSNVAIDLMVTLPDKKYTGDAAQHRVFLLAGDSKIIPVRQLIRSCDLAPGSLSIGTIMCRTALGTTTGALVQVNAVGQQMYDDLNFDADKVMLWLGDSITADATGIGDSLQGYHAKVRSYFRDRGSNLRLINMSISGSTTRDHDRLRSLGKYNLPQLDLIVYSLGVNNAFNLTTNTYSVTTTTGSTTVVGLFTSADVGASITGTGIPANTTIASVTDTSATLSAAATASGTISASVTYDAVNSYNADLASLIAWKQMHYPGAKLLVLGPTPVTNDTNEAKVASIRAAGASSVSAANDPKILYCSLASAFDRTNAANYAGDGLHPQASAGAHVAIYNTIKSFLTSNNVTV